MSTASSVGGRALLALFAASLAIRIAGVALHPPSEGGDESLYRGLARGIASGTGYVYDGQPNTHVHPLLPVLHAAALLGIHDDRTAGMVVTLLIGSLLPVVAAWVIGTAFGRPAALLSALLLALEPHHVLASATLCPDLLGAVLAFVLTATLMGERWVVAGAVVGLGYLNRPEAVFWFPAAATYAHLRGASLRSVGLMILATLVVASPFVLYVHHVEGRWAFSGKDQWVYLMGVNQYRSRNQPLDIDRIPELRREIASPLDHVEAHPREFVAGYAYRTWILVENVGRQTGYGLLVACAVFGLVTGFRKARAATWALVVPLAAVPALPIGATFFRHSEMPAAVILALAGVGIAELMDHPFAGA